MIVYEANEAIAISMDHAIKSGDLSALNELLDKNPGIAAAYVARPASSKEFRSTQSWLHSATDWPGNYPNGSAVVELLIRSGADVNSRFNGRHGETPLHWAASSDDVAVLDMLLNHGADIEAKGAVIGGGTPLADAVAFGQWNAARRLVERGAKTTLWQAAALGLIDRVEAHFEGDVLPPWPLQIHDSNEQPPNEITHAFWCACHGGQLKTAKYLVSKGADIHWRGYDNLSPLGAARRAEARELIEWLTQRGAKE